MPDAVHKVDEEYHSDFTSWPFRWMTLLTLSRAFALIFTTLHEKTHKRGPLELLQKVAKAMR